MSARRIAGLGLALSVVLCAAPIASAGPLYVQATGIPGASVDKDHPLWIEAASYSVSVDASGARPNLSAFSVVLATDASLPKLLAAHGQQTAIPSITIDVMGPAGASGSPTVAMQIKLTNARVKDLTLTADGNGPAMAAAFSYDGIDFEYRVAGGKAPATSVRGGYTISTNSAR
jgi:hypothetical protein